jgi:hypothetical protein
LEDLEHRLKSRNVLVVCGEGLFNCEIQFDLILILWKVFVLARCNQLAGSAGSKQRLIVVHHQHFVRCLAHVHLNHVANVGNLSKCFDCVFGAAPRSTSMRNPQHPLASHSFVEEWVCIFAKGSQQVRIQKEEGA